MKNNLRKIIKIKFEKNKNIRKHQLKFFQKLLSGEAGNVLKLFNKWK
jgi:hypothetical protein